MWRCKILGWVDGGGLNAALRHNDGGVLSHIICGLCGLACRRWEKDRLQIQQRLG